MKRLEKVTKRLSHESQTPNDSQTLTRLELPLDDAIMFDLLKWAIQKQSLEVIASLIEQGIDVNAKSDHCGLTALHYAAMGNSLEIVQLLVSKGADIQARDKSGKIPLHRAAGAWSCIDVFRYLVSQSVDIFAQDKSGRTPYGYALDNMPEKQRILCEKMADLYPLPQES